MRRHRRRQRWGRGLGVMVVLALVLAAAVLLLNGLPRAPEEPARAAPAPAAAPTPTPDARPVVAIDPGHGGVDRGSEGPGFGEHEMTWRTANELYALLEQDGRLRPFLTISEDESQNPEVERIMPSERAKRAAAQGAALLLSIHGNSDTVYGASGYECYAIPPGRNQHEESLRFAGLLTERFSALGQRLRGTNGVRYIYYDDDDNKGAGRIHRRDGVRRPHLRRAGIRPVPGGAVRAVLFDQQRRCRPAGRRGRLRPRGRAVLRGHLRMVRPRTAGRGLTLQHSRGQAPPTCPQTQGHPMTDNMGWPFL